MAEASEQCDRLRLPSHDTMMTPRPARRRLKPCGYATCDARLGRIIIVKLDATPVPPRFANRDYWDFTKVPGDEVMDEFKRRMSALKPIETDGGKKSRKRTVANSTVPVAEPAWSPLRGGLSPTIIGNHGPVTVAGGDVKNEHTTTSPRCSTSWSEEATRSAMPKPPS